MARPRLLEDITIGGTVDVRDTLPTSPTLHSGGGHEMVKIVSSQKHKANPSKTGINSNSPVVYVTEQTKRLLKLLKADIYIREGYSLSENAILSRIIQEYCHKSCPEFYNNYKSIIDSL